MAFMNFRKKRKKVPDELPSLISDEIEEESLTEINNALKEEKEEKEEFQRKEEVRKKEEDAQREEVQKQKTSTNVVNRLIKGVEDTPTREITKIASDKSFFAEMQKKIVEDLDDVDALEDWYDEKINSGDIVKKMKSYWNSQKKVSVLDLMAKNFKEKISQKVSELQKLEKDWQTIYFELIEKEELIKEAEAGLKEMVSEFMVICKDKKNAMSKNHFEESILVENKNKKNKKKKKQGVIDEGENNKDQQKEEIEK